MIILPNHKNLTINTYKDTYVPIPIDSFPFLYTHYQVFLSINSGKKCNIEQLYRSIMLDDPVYKHICSHEVPINMIINKQFRQYLIDQSVISLDDDEHYVNAIIKHKTESDNNYYLVWWDHLPYGDASWEPSENVTEHSRNEYHQRIETQLDQDYI